MPLETKVIVLGPFDPIPAQALAIDLEVFRRRLRLGRGRARSVAMRPSRATLRKGRPKVIDGERTVQLSVDACPVWLCMRVR
jgi:hypothetical protein